jgi:hypothetical protein
VAAVTRPLTRTEEERRLETLQIHSELWDDEEGTVRWRADHPSGWYAEGVAGSADEAQDAVEAAALAGVALVEGETEFTSGTRLTAMDRGGEFLGIAETHRGPKEG